MYSNDIEQKYKWNNATITKHILPQGDEEQIRTNLTYKTTSARTNITKTCLYNFNPLKPHFYIVNQRFTGVYINFLISAQKNLDCGTR